MTTLGGRLQAAIERRNWSGREAARRLGISQQTVRNLLADQTHRGDPFRPSRATLLKIADGLGEPVHPWLALAGYEVDKVDQGAEMLAGKIDLLSPDDRQAIEQLVDSLLISKGYVHPAVVRAHEEVARPVGHAVSVEEGALDPAAQP
ncbi:helix-turn-helix domain-containing protein [Actinosynnema mirum]|uniref:helix-turn-helix domain-containing protein n=1 Tax=Actinosynnema mirum TaxID=40567 RepID=UPI00019AB741|nr:helix-turn-helix transcriptional regulator [Actinosynnema mirum]